MHIRNFSIRFNLTLLILSASVLAVILASLGFAIHERQSYHASAVRELTALADTLGANTGASLAFNDQRTATEILSALATEPSVLIACLYDNQGRIFAEFRSAGAPPTLVLPARRGDGAYFDGESLTLFRGVLLNSERTGSIALVFDLRGFRARLFEYAKIAFLVLLVSVFATFLASMRLARSIGDPLVQLAAVARRISADKDYSVRAGIRAGGTDLSKPLARAPPDAALEETQKKLQPLRQKPQQQEQSGQPLDPKDIQEFMALQNQHKGLAKAEQDRQQERYQGDWAARVEQNGKVSGVYTDYHYYGTGDIGGSPDEESVKRLEAIVTKGTASLPPPGKFFVSGQPHPEWPPMKVGDGPVHVISANADQMFLDITPAESAGLPRYTGEMELTNHSAGSLTSQAYQKRWIRKEELLADAAEKASIAAEWLGARPYPIERLNDAWTLAMGGHFHDIAAGTATPKSYEFAWNDDVIAMNQFAGVLSNATEAVAAALNTETAGVPVVVFNPLNIAREDLVEASLTFPGGTPDAVHVVGPDGRQAAAQISRGKVLFVARVPSVGYAVYDVQPGAAPADTTSILQVSDNSLENRYYRVKLNADGDVASIFDKSIGRELLAAPARLAISYDNPQQWPAWNMDWDQEQAAPKAYVGGPARMRVVESGPARVAIEVSREAAGSVFVQTISLSAGDAGKRVESANVIDWNTRESNLKATFPLAASSPMATYNWDIGTIERPSAEPKKFEVPSHQWIDLTDMRGEFGATVLTDCKNGSDKPNDHTIRLTLIRTPGTRGGYPDQGTQDLGHHEFVYGIAGHAADWRHAGTDWQAQRLNDPLIAFEASQHAGALGREFSLLNVSNSRIRLLALKKAEQGDELIARLVELDGQPQPDVRVSFASPIAAAREVNGQEQPVGPATVTGGALVTSFTAYQPRTFAVKLAAAPTGVAQVRSRPVALPYDLATASNDGTLAAGGFDGKGHAMPAEMLPVARS